jgi:hypothetical protein
VPLVGAPALRRSLPAWLKWTSAVGFAAALFSLFISAYPFVNVISPRTYAIKILTTIVVSNLIAVGFYVLRTRTTREEKAALEDAA